MPTRGVPQLVEALRKVKGLQLLLFNENDWMEDEKYKGGTEAPQALQVTETVRRQTGATERSAQAIVVRLSSAGIQQLRDGNPQQYDRLMTLMRDAFNEHRRVQGLPVVAPAPPPPAATIIGILF